LCRMSLVLSKNPLSKFEMAFKSAWAKDNSDGCGIFWRDSPSIILNEERHLARITKSTDLAKISRTYDRLFIHFRNATQGEGTHPFACIHKPENESGNWLLAHNGVVDDKTAKEKIAENHKFSTKIDSECFVHLWAEVDHRQDMTKQIEDFAKLVRETEISGWANLIFYNVVTDEWVGFCDTLLGLVTVKDLTVVCSDANWLVRERAEKAGAKIQSLHNGDVVYGKGTAFKIMEHVWDVAPTVQSYSYGGGMGTGVGYWVNRDGDLASAPNKDDLAEAQTHDFVSYGDEEEGEDALCSKCYVEKYLHKKTEKVDKLATKGRHAYTRDPKSGLLRCGVCNETGTFGTHLAHKFEPINQTTYCEVCGNERVVGNHLEENPSNHFFTPMQILKTEKGKDKWEESEVCGRCAFVKVQHTSNPNTTNEVMITPVGCACRPEARLICQEHWRRGFRKVDTKGHIIKGEDVETKSNSLEELWKDYAGFGD